MANEVGVLVSFMLPVDVGRAAELDPRVLTEAVQDACMKSLSQAREATKFNAAVDAWRAQGSAWDAPGPSSVPWSAAIYSADNAWERVTALLRGTDDA